MKVKFDKYWGDFSDTNMLLFVAVVLDPRYKMKYFEFLFTKYYNLVEGCKKCDKVQDTLTSLYAYYKSSIYGISCENIGDQTSVISEIDAVGSSDVWQSQWEKYLEKESNVDDKSDLEKYLKGDEGKN